MEQGYELLVEKESMWAEMLIQVLKDNDIPCTSLPVHGAGFSIKTGIQDRLKVYVPTENLERAKELLEELFSAKAVMEE